MKVKFYYTSEQSLNSHDPKYEEFLEYIHYIRSIGKFGYFDGSKRLSEEDDHDAGFWIEFEDSEEYLIIKIKYPFLKEYVDKI